MKRNTGRMLGGLLLASSVSFGTAALADDTAMHHDKGDKGMSMMDTDHDGQISSTEHAAAAQKMFMQADANKDGKVTQDELKAAHKGMMDKHEGMMGKHDETGDQKAMSDHQGMGDHKDAMAHDKMSSSDWFKSMDTNGDGSLSATEHAAAAEARFKKMDANNDGKVSAEEMKAGHKAMAAQNEE